MRSPSYPAHTKYEIVIAFKVVSSLNCFIRTSRHNLERVSASGLSASMKSRMLDIKTQDLRKPHPLLPSNTVLNILVTPTELYSIIASVLTILLS
uniref:Uncharacterized protein n=1 Tax=Salix viminalis TaxID=40686 RepID=A0A6N2K2W8_SALVM